VIEELQMASVLAPAALMIHDTGVSVTPSRRRFTVAYKRSIVRDAARCTQPGDLAALLRREGLYSSHLAAWRAAERRGELTGPTRRRGPPATPGDPQATRIAVLERQLAKAMARAERAEGLVALQKKVAELFGQTLDTPRESR
jgi:transposase